MISVIIPAYNNSALTLNCLGDVIKTCGVEYEVLLVDDCSTEPVYRVIPKLFRDVKVLRNDTNVGFIKSVNAGLRQAKGDYLLLLNNDLRISDPGWLIRLLGGTTTRGLDLSSVAGGVLDADLNYVPGETKTETGEFSYLVGWCLLFSRQVYETLGPLDEIFGVGLFDDADYSFRARAAGFKLGIIEGVGLTHLYHQTFLKSGYNITEQYLKNREIFVRKHGRK